MTAVVFRGRKGSGRRTLAVCSMAAGLGALFLVAPAQAQSVGESVLYAFQGGNDGAYVQSGVVTGSAGVIYGTTRDGGSGDCTDYWSNGEVVGCGIIYSLTPPATEGNPWTETILYTFTGGADGAFPGTLSISSSGALYGLTGNGGPGAVAGVGGNGVVFELAPPKKSGLPWKETVLYSFCSKANCTDGSGGGDDVLLSGTTTLYGTTDYGGATGNGTVFKLTLPTSTSKAKLATIYSFQGGTDGAVPFYGVTAGKSGVLYGETYAGGGTGCGGSGCGTVYELTPPTSGTTYTEAVLYSFTGGNDGANPTGKPALLSSGTLLGVGGGGGSTGYGTIFELAPPKTSGNPWTFSLLTTFGEGSYYGIPDGSYPNGGLVAASNGSIYGATSGGGDPNIINGFIYPGTIFELTPPIATGGAWVRSMLYTFQGGNDGIGATWGLVAGPEGTLLGTTTLGGGNGCPVEGGSNGPIGCGTVFVYTP